MFRIAVPFALMLAVVLPGPCGWAAPLYTFLTFDVPGSSGFTAPVAIDNAGQVVGDYYVAGSPLGQFLAFSRTPDGGFTSLSFGGTSGDTYVGDINNLGQIVGFYRTDPGGAARAFLLGADGSYTAVDVPFAVGGTTYAALIDDAGQIIGAYGSGGTFYLREPDGTYSDITPVLSGMPNAVSIDYSGPILGSYPNGGGYCGRVPFTSYQGFVRFPDGTYVDVNIPGANYGAIPLGINKRGEIVGKAYTFNSSTCSESLAGFVLEPDGTSFSLTVPGTAPGSAIPYGINDSGQITGTVGADGFIATPVAAVVPEPYGISVIGAGLAGLAALRRRARDGRLRGIGWRSRRW